MLVRFCLRIVRGEARRTEGQVLVLFALSSFVLLGFMALSIDGGFIMAERRQVQSAADAGALAAARAALGREPASVVTASGKTYAALNADIPESVVAVNRPPKSGPHAGDTNFIEVVVEKDVQKFFLAAVYAGDWRVSARAVAGLRPVKKPYALLALREPGIYINGTTGVYIEGGSAMSNAGISSSGTTNVFAAGGSIDATGTIQDSPKWSANEGINPNTPPVSDPLLGTPPPPKGTKRNAPSCTSDCMLEPGYYDNQNIVISKTATLKPGIYYFDGTTNVNLLNTNSMIKGDGVLLYFTGKSKFTPGNGNIDLTAPKVSLYPGGVDGMLLWIADPNCSAFDSSGNGVFKIEGVIYAPCSHVELHGTPSSNGIQVIVGDLVLKGTSDFRITYREYVKMDVPRVRLVE